LEVRAGKTFIGVSSVAHPNGEKTSDDANEGSVRSCHCSYPLAADAARCRSHASPHVRGITLLSEHAKKYMLNMDILSIARLKILHPRK
jgi:hypothetical protein